ncbi:MAG TPA: AtpZ/AtpI family protein [Ignavibacteria bacterium]|nr:AtpZ/AtpI family protein [Ignavibacteria bacterium]HMR39018.1 AtpZ/AtpI family protein [Ignavibacteria bacterium]
MDDNQKKSEESDPKNSETNSSSLKKILSKPLLKADSKFAQYSGLGISLVVTILLFLWVGMWLDGKFDTGVLFTLILSFTGFAAGFYSFYLNIKKLTEKDKIENKKFNKY